MAKPRDHIKLTDLLLPGEDASQPNFDWLPVVERSAELGPASAGLGGMSVELEAGVYRFSDTWVFRRPVHLAGRTRWGTEINTAWGKDAILLSWTRAHGAGVARADGSIIERVLIQAFGLGNPGRGIVMRAPCMIEKTGVRGFLDGIDIYGWGEDPNPLTASAANLWRLTDVEVSGCYRDGVRVNGPDANAGVALCVNASSNGRHGFNDTSFLGNTYVACHAAGNKGAPYVSADPNARSFYLNCYAEQDQPPAQIAPPAMVAGGNVGVEGGGGHLHMGGGELAVRTLRSLVNGLTARLGGNAALRSVLEFADGASIFRLLREHASLGKGWWGLNYQALGAGTVAGVCDNSAAEYAQGFGPGPKLAAPAGVMLGAGAGRMLVTTWPTPPASGTWKQGALVWNSRPARGAPMGWTCVKDGTPGEWAPLPNLPA